MSGARPSLDESVRTSRGLGSICIDLSGYYRCKIHGIASEPVFGTFCHFFKRVIITFNFPYAPQRLFICVTETSFGKDEASTMFLFQVERVRYPSVIQSHRVGSATTQVTGLLVVTPGLRKGQHPWCFVWDPNSLVIIRRDIESDWLKGNVSVTYERPVTMDSVPLLSGRVTCSAPQRKPEYALHLLPTYTHSVISGSWMQLLNANVHWLD